MVSQISAKTSEIWGTQYLLLGDPGMVMSLVQLGRMEYSEALAVQARVSELRKQDQIGDVLLLVEHPPVLTLGRNSHREHVVAGDEHLARRGITLFETNRGGDVTYHGPGQLVGYPVIHLRGFTPPIGIVDYLRKLEEVLIRTCADFGVLTDRIAGRAGVWTIPGGAIPEKKIAALGVHVSRWVTTHGFALNVTTDLTDFNLIVPCGITDRGVTSLEAEVAPGPPPSLEQTSHAVTRHFGRVFDRQMVWVESLQALMPNAMPLNGHPASVGLL